MPSAPEIGEVNGCIGLAKILFQTKPKDPAQPDGHVRVTTKIEVNLGRKTNDSDPGQRHIELLSREAEYLIGHVPEVIGK